MLRGPLLPPPPSQTSRASMYAAMGGSWMVPADSASKVAVLLCSLPFQLTPDELLAFLKATLPAHADDLALPSACPAPALPSLPLVLTCPSCTRRRLHRDAVEHGPCDG